MVPKQTSKQTSILINKKKSISFCTTGKDWINKFIVSLLAIGPEII